MLALTGNALAAVFCPHMSGRECCVKSPAQTGQSADKSHIQSQHDEMSDMDMSHEATDMAEAQTAEANGSPESNATLTASDEQIVESVTPANEPCSHCMMHSQTNATYSLRAAIDNSPSYQISAADGRPEISSPLSPTTLSGEVHDHGPPGSSAPLYVLVSSFRI